MPQIDRGVGCFGSARPSSIQCLASMRRPVYSHPSLRHRYNNPAWVLQITERRAVGQHSPSIRTIGDEVQCLAFFKCFVCSHCSPCQQYNKPAWVLQIAERRAVGQCWRSIQWLAFSRRPSYRLRCAQQINNSLFMKLFFPRLEHDTCYPDRRVPFLHHGRRAGECAADEGQPVCLFVHDVRYAKELLRCAFVRCVCGNRFLRFPFTSLQDRK